MHRTRGGLAHDSSSTFLERRVAHISERFDGDTQKTRTQLILDLQSLLEVTKEQVLSIPGKRGRQHQEWIRIAAYLSQVINSVSKTYDIAQIKRQLDELRKQIEELTQKRANTNEK